MYACMHVCLFVYAHIYIFKDPNEFMYACIYVCMFACIHACMYVCMHACVHVCKFEDMCFNDFQAVTVAHPKFQYLKLLTF